MSFQKNWINVIVNSSVVFFSARLTKQYTYVYTFALWRYIHFEELYAIKCKKNPRKLRVYNQVFLISGKTWSRILCFCQKHFPDQDRVNKKNSKIGPSGPEEIGTYIDSVALVYRYIRVFCAYVQIYISFIFWLRQSNVKY